MIRYAIEKADRILVVAHVDPDGDAIGSLTAMGQALRQMRKRVIISCEDGVPGRFAFLPLAADVVKTPPVSEPYDLIIALDCADAQRMGRPFSGLPDPKPSLINIDHHVTNTLFGDFNLIQPQASSTAEVLVGLFEELGVDITPSIADSLLAGIVTDTLAFRTNSVTPQTLRIAADLVEAGGDLSGVSLQAMHLKSLPTAHLWRIGLGNMHVDGRLLWTSISQDNTRANGLEGNSSSSGLVNFLSDVDGAAMGVVLTEMPDGSVRVGLRCHPPYDVAEVAMQFGGGGHKLAAGCTLPGPLPAAETRIVAACRDAIRRQSSNGKD